MTLYTHFCVLWPWQADVITRCGHIYHRDCIREAVVHKVGPAAPTNATAPCPNCKNPPFSGISFPSGQSDLIIVIAVVQAASPCRSTT
jgi:hypothetical protein